DRLVPKGLNGVGCRRAARQLPVVPWSEDWGGQKSRRAAVVGPIRARDAELGTWELVTYNPSRMESAAAALPSSQRAYLAVTVAALGYFVDIYDLILFSIVRVPSLRGIGVPQSEILSTGVYLLNMQMAGMLIGGILWGILGDKRGRLSVLFGSIFLYSVGNIANGMVHTVPMYAVFRFIAGVGLAGELGAGITLVSEVLPSRVRGYGTTIVASFGILGAVVASLIGDAFSWRAAFYVGGVMGLLLLALRIGVVESGMFQQVRQQDVSRGNFLMLFRSRKR